MHWKKAVRKFTRFSSQEDANLETIAGSVFKLFNLWFTTMFSKKSLQFFLSSKFFFAAFTLVEYYCENTNCPRFLHQHQYMLSAMMVANS